MVDDFKDYFDNIHFEQIPRLNNKAADAMATIRSLVDMKKDNKKCEFLITELPIPAYDVPQSKLVCEVIGPLSPWYQETYLYLHDNILPPNLSTSQRKSFIHRASHFILIGDTLYKRSLDGMLI